jgi:hypothetical protein
MTLSLAQEPRAMDMPPMTETEPRLLAALKLHRLRTPAQIATVQHLRSQIDLSVHAAAGQEFVRLEKKETTWASCSASSSMVS